MKAETKLTLVLGIYSIIILLIGMPEQVFVDCVWIRSYDLQLKRVVRKVDSARASQ